MKAFSFQQFIPTLTFLLGAIALSIRVLGSIMKKRNERLEAIEKKLELLPVIMERMNSVEERTQEDRETTRQALKDIYDLIFDKIKNH